MADPSDPPKHITLDTTVGLTASPEEASMFTVCEKAVALPQPFVIVTEIE